MIHSISPPPLWRNEGWSWVACYAAEAVRRLVCAYPVGNTANGFNALPAIPFGSVLGPTPLNVVFPAPSHAGRADAVERTIRAVLGRTAGLLANASKRAPLRLCIILGHENPPAHCFLYVAM